MTTEENKALVRRYLEDALAEVRGGNLDATNEFLTTDATFYDPGQPPSVGPEAQKQRSVMLLGAFPDARFAIEDMVAEGDKVVVRWTFHGTHQGNFMGVPPTGQEVKMVGITIHRLDSGKIAEAWSNLDQLGMLQQFGVIPHRDKAQGKLQGNFARSLHEAEESGCRSPGSFHVRWASEKISWWKPA